MAQEGESTEPGLISYKGLNLIKHVHEESYIDTLQEFEILNNDIFCVTYPRSGTTWMQFILALMFHPDELEGENQKHSVTIVPWIEVKRWNMLSFVPSPRLFVSHLLPDLLPPNLRERAKVIYIARNPKDVVVSLFHFQSLFKLLPDKDNFDTFLDEFLEGKVFGSSWFDHVRDWHNQKEKYDLLFLTYEELKKDLKGTICKMSRFLNKTLDEETLDMIVEKTSFDNMRKIPNANVEIVMPDLFEGSKGSFLRKGKVGDWKTLFTIAQSERFDKIYKEKMKGVHLEFDLDL